MARQIKWRLQFKSLNNTGCLVNIYEDGYTGSSADTTKTGADVPFAVETGVTELTGADVPFEYEEDDSSDLLEFIRIKTGYLRVVESEFGALNSLMPTSIQHHFVEAFYGSERVFTGFMQCQEFDSPWVAAPRVLEFPVVSPLGLLEAINFSVPDTHELVTLGTLMHEVMCGLNPSASSTSSSPDSDYSNVINPSITDACDPWDFVTNSTVFIPLNSEFEHYDPNIVGVVTPEMWIPQSYKYLIEGICKCFGWIVHDTPSSIVFSKYDDTNSYYLQISVAGLLSFQRDQYDYIGMVTPSINQYYDNIDDNAMQTVILPLKEIIINTGNGNIGKKELSTKYSILEFSTLPSSGQDWIAIPLTQVGPNVTGTNIGKANINVFGDITLPGLFPLAYGVLNNGKFNIDESWVIKYDTSWSKANPIITAKFFGNQPINNEGWTLFKLNCEYGSSIKNMQSSGYGNMNFWMVIKLENKYYDINNDTFYDNITYNAISIEGATGKIFPHTPSFTGDVDDKDGIFIKVGRKIIGCVEISLHPKENSNIANGYIIRITEMSLNNPSNNLVPYYEIYNFEKQIRLDGNKSGNDTKEIDVDFNNYVYVLSENSIGQRDNYSRGSYPTYQYMFKPLYVLYQKVKQKAVVNRNEYMIKWIYDTIIGWRWRMLAKNFNLRDDEYTITLARSSTIE